MVTLGVLGSGWVQQAFWTRGEAEQVAKQRAKAATVGAAVSCLLLLFYTMHCIMQQVRFIRD